MLPVDAKERKGVPIYSGFIKYFPDAIAAVAELSRIGNDQHNPGKPLHWDRSKSGDELDALARHLSEAGTVDNDGVRHSTKVAWRALANLQKEIEAGERKTGAKPWIMNTGKRPADESPYTMIQSEMRDGEITSPYPIKAWRWEFDGGPKDIIRWRLA